MGDVTIERLDGAAARAAVDELAAVLVDGEPCATVVFYKRLTPTP